MALPRGPAATGAIVLSSRGRLLHAHFGQAAPLAWRTARRLGRPFGVSLHGYDLLVAAAEDPAILRAVRAAQLVVVPSRFLADAAADRGVPDEVLRVIPSGLDLAELPFRERSAPGDGSPITVTFAGRFVPKKGVLDAARAIAQVTADRRTRPGALRARFVGYGEQEPELRRLLAELDLTDAQIVDGRAPQAVRDALTSTDVLLTASRVSADGDAETLGLVNLEAQAMGVPVVTTRSGGVPEAVCPTSTVFAADGSPSALAQALDHLLARPESWAARGRAGRRHVADHFELGARTADLEEQWLRLVAGRKATAGTSSGPVRSPRPSRHRAERVSVVMVTKNRRDLLERCLDALAAQTRPADEVLVVDNGSTDGTADLLSARTTPKGLVVLSGPSDGSVAHARNLAVARAGGDVIAFTDDDCRPRPTWLEALAAGLRDGVDIVQGRTIADPQQELRPLSRTQWTPCEWGGYETCNIAYDRRVLPGGGDPAAGPFDLDFAGNVAAALGPLFARYPFGEDTEMAWRVKRAGAVSRFAACAVVEHHVFPPDTRLQLRRAFLTAGFPLLVQRVPELRRAMLWRRYLLTPQRARTVAAVSGAAYAAITRDGRPLVLAVPYAVEVLRTLQPLRSYQRRARLRAMPVLIARDLVETVALGYGSLRARRVVL